MEAKDKGERKKEWVRGEEERKRDWVVGVSDASRESGLMMPDNKGVLMNLRKGRGFCGEGEQLVRRMGGGLLKRGWEVRLEWVPGHVGIEKNEEVNVLVKEGVWEEVEGELGEILCWGK